MFNVGMERGTVRWEGATHKLDSSLGGLREGQGYGSWCSRTLGVNLPWRDVPDASSVVGQHAALQRSRSHRLVARELE